MLEHSNILNVELVGVHKYLQKYSKFPQKVKMSAQCPTNVHKSERIRIYLLSVSLHVKSDAVMQHIRICSDAEFG